MLQPSNISNYMPKDENGDKGTRTETDFDRSFDQDSFILKLPNFDFKQGTNYDGTIALIKGRRIWLHSSSILNLNMPTRLSW
ncbi:hypothetical protein P8452_57847 [Trifolium repens]|nr:hypothetical protein P8452_57847 [Trifolium repens]